MEAGVITSSCKRMGVVRAVVTSPAPQSAASPLPSHEPPITSSVAPPLSLRGAIISDTGVSLKTHPTIAWRDAPPQRPPRSSAAPLALAGLSILQGCGALDRNKTRVHANQRLIPISIPSIGNRSLLPQSCGFLSEGLV